MSFISRQKTTSMSLSFIYNLILRTCSRFLYSLDTSFNLYQGPHRSMALSEPNKLLLIGIPTENLNSRNPKSWKYKIKNLQRIYKELSFVKKN